ncbi:MAG: Rieske (2Fe-2S) protein, partial [Metallosphaera sp.]
MGRHFVLKREDFVFATRLIRRMKDPKTRFDERKFAEKGRDYLYNYAEEKVGPLDKGRRSFLKGILIGIGVLAVASAVPVISYLNQPPVYLKNFPWIIIVDSDGNPIEASKLTVN